MQNKLLIAALGTALAVPAFAADSYTIDPRHTHPTYEINHFGWSTQRGRFDNVTGKITLDRAAQERNGGSLHRRRIRQQWRGQAR